MFSQITLHEIIIELIWIKLNLLNHFHRGYKALRYHDVVAD